MTLLTSLKFLVYPALIAACIGLYDAESAAKDDAEESQTSVQIFTGRITSTLASLEAPEEEDSVDVVSHTLMVKVLLADLDKSFKIEDPTLREQLKSEDSAVVKGALETLREMLPGLAVDEVAEVEAPPVTLRSLMRQMSTAGTETDREASSSDEEDPYQEVPVDLPPRNEQKPSSGDTAEAWGGPEVKDGAWEVGVTSTSTATPPGSPTTTTALQPTTVTQTPTE